MLTTNPFDDDKLKEECGIIGIFGVEEASTRTVLGLHALQHRGQEAAGIVSHDGEDFHAHRAMGHVADNFSHHDVVGRLKGRAAIGHVRYSTTGETALRNVQPFFAELAFGGIAIGHNGNLTNAAAIRREMVKRGSIFQASSDTEVIPHLMATHLRGNVVDRLINALHQVEGAYSIVAIAKDMVIGVRDPLGVRPMVLGKLGDGYILASETCALDIMSADYIRDVEAGEMVILDKNGVTSLRPFSPTKHRFCVFEYIYFARPDSVMEGVSVYDARKRIGAELAKEAGVDADVVIPVPDSGVPAALGYAEGSGIPFEYGIIRNHYVGRTFIEPTDQIRHLGVKLKHNANRAKVNGKRIILVDDSIVRGTTSKKIVEMMRQAGATEVHMRISSPPTSYSCFYGIDTPERSKLLAARMSVQEMADFIGCDSLAFISLDGLYRAMGHTEGRDSKSPQYCDACFTGDYPTELTDQSNENITQLSLLAEKSA
ncbi:amidophosphoribosyltransferase [Dongia mobilis]|uniref:amidophosphoribosyltransferase n=1 Tax=Dongia sp. TaxID=1977262 RepID=UPI0026EC99A8